MLLSLVRLAPQLPTGECRPVGTVHDSILFEVQDEKVDQYMALIKSVMEDMAYVEKVFKCEITVPIEVDFKTSQYWGGKGN